MKNITYLVAPMVPSKGINPEFIRLQFDWRNTGKYNGPSFIGIAEMEEPIWWNRPLESNTFVKKEADGIYSYNLPLAWQEKNMAWKANYNVLLNKFNVPVAGMIKINPAWTIKQKNMLKRSMIDGVYRALIKLGVPAENLTQPSNDLLYKGKKFFGVETIEKNGWFSMNCFITLRYTPEKDIFDRLTGTFVQRKEITGIIEETELFTREQFIKVLLDELKTIYDQLD